MGRSGGFDFRELEVLRRNLEKLDGELAFFIEGCAKELAARLLAKVIKRTPVGDYSKEIDITAKRDSKHHKKGDVYKKTVNPSGKTGGTLRRGWTGEQSGKAKEYAQSLRVNHVGGTYIIEVVNPVEYTSYVEFGHRTRGGKGWVAGKFMLTISEQEIRRNAPAILERKIKKQLGACFR